MNHAETYRHYYFIGIGGIGMSALARYFHQAGHVVGGYDKTPSPLTAELQAEGMLIHFDDCGPAIPAPFNQIEQTLVIYTPAIPRNMGELLHVQHSGYRVMKRAEVLGLITRQTKGIGVAGTHGKTTTSTMLAHILYNSPLSCAAFLGGISTNYHSNFIANDDAEYTVIEADEFDRSFLQLSPYAAIITSTDADHLDIYGDADHVREGFQLYAEKVSQEGFLILRHGLPILPKGKCQTYGVEAPADWKGTNLRSQENRFLMDVIGPDVNWTDVELGLPGIHNAENALACCALSHQLGLNEQDIRHGLSSFRGVKRRFELHLRSEKLIYIDDYAHHPTEIAALIGSVRQLYPGLRVTALFQPHLFSRTRDFMDGFARELSRVDELILLPIYPAREEPIPGITSEVLLDSCTAPMKHLLPAREALEKASSISEGVILTVGAGDIDRITDELRENLKKQLLNNPA